MMIRPPVCARRYKAYTLIEIIIVLLIMASIAGSVVQVTYSTNADRSSCVLMYKSFIEQLRETAIANNCFVEVQLDETKVKVEALTASDAEVFNNEFSSILGMAPKSLSKFEVEMAQICSQLADVKFTAKLQDGSKQNTFVFTESGSIEDGKDRYIYVESDRYSAPMVIKIHGYTGLVEIP